MAKFKVVEVLPLAERTADGNTHTAPIGVEEFREAQFYLLVTAKAGTNPTLDVTIESKIPKNDVFIEHTKFTQINTTGKEVKNLANLGGAMAILYDIGGTDTPKFTFGVYAVFKE
jgi:hypothetical protein